MTKTLQELTEALVTAEKERTAHAEGRLAFRNEGSLARNPYPPGSPEHGLWADGLRLARESEIKRRHV